VTDLLRARTIGASIERLDGPAKVAGTARYAFEQPVDDPLYVHMVQATIARGRVTAIDGAAATGLLGVVAVLTHENAPRMASGEDRELWALQSGEVAFRGQPIAAVVAETPEVARHAARLIRVSYAEQPHDVELHADRDDLYAPGHINPALPTDTADGDADAALAAAPVVLDQTYSTPMEHNNPMEPHTTVAIWEGEGTAARLTMYDSSQGPHRVRLSLAQAFGLDPARVRVISPHVGGGFGCKGFAHVHNALAALAAQAVPGRPVKLALTRQQMFAIGGYRPPTIQRLRLGAQPDGRLTGIVHEVVEQSATLKEFAEQTGVPSRFLYAAPNRRVTHRLAALDVPVPSWMRAPGVAPGMFAVEVAMDELALACGLDPIELRARNDPRFDPETGKPWSGRKLVECLREGARRFGWEGRDPTPAARHRDGWLIGTGVASSVYERHSGPGSRAVIRYGADGAYTVGIGAVDIGTGTWTALTQIAADALGCPVQAIRLRIGDTEQPIATVAGGSTGVSNWGSAIVGAARAFRDRHGMNPDPGAEVEAAAPEDPEFGRMAVYSFGAQFAEVRVQAETGEIRVPRMLGVFSPGRIVNPRLARSQFLGGMIMGLSMALHEHSVVDPRFGHVVNHDFAEYHVAANADVADLDAIWLDEEDPYSNPMGTRGIGEIGIVGAAAAIANATWHATGVRIRDLPITPGLLLS
jgi:xanthine dehydrogenase YagR molybdenum-binding subunit